MINLECVATFLAVAQYGSFRAAAEHTGLSQPAVSQHVKRLEASLKVSLIDRSNAGSTLTPEGQAFLPYAEVLIQTSNRARTLFDKETLVVGASSNIGIYVLQPYLKDYKDRVPHTVDAVIGDNNAIADKLQNLAIDVAVMEWWDGRPGFDAHLWRQEGLVVIVPPGHPWVGQRSIALHALKGMPVLGGETGTGTGRQLQRCLGDEAHSIQVSMQLGSTEAVKHAVHAGLGISIVMATAVAEECRSGWLHAIPLENNSLQKDIYIVRRRGGPYESLASQFVRFLLQS